MYEAYFLHEMQTENPVREVVDRALELVDEYIQEEKPPVADIEVSAYELIENTQKHGLKEDGQNGYGMVTMHAAPGRFSICTINPLKSQIEPVIPTTKSIVSSSKEGEINISDLTEHGRGHMIIRQLLGETSLRTFLKFDTDLKLYIARLTLQTGKKGLN